MWFEGNVTGMDGFIDMVRDNALACGWEVLRDTTAPYDKIPADLESVTSSADKAGIKNYFDGRDDTVGSASNFILTMPYYLKPVGYILHNQNAAALTIKGRDTDLSLITLVDGAATYTDSGTITTDKSFMQYEITISSPQNVREFNIIFENDIAFARELILYSSGFGGEDNIYVGFKGFAMPQGAQNVAVSAFTGYGQLAAFESQPNHCPNHFLYMHEKNITYWLSVDKHRILGAIKIYESLDAHEKAPVYQFLHLGYVTAYGLPSQLPAPYAIIGGGTDKTKRWSGVDTTLPTKPTIFTPYPHYITADTLIDGLTEANTPYQHDTNASLFSLPISLFSAAENTLFGEFDGFIKTIATNQTKSEDIVTIEGEEHIIIQNGKKLTLVDYFGIRKN